MTLTERQQKWFATVQANLEAQTGKPLAEWVEIVKASPETAPRARQAWLKTNYGVGQNHAAHILDAAAPDSEKLGWDEPERLRAALWSDAGSLAILEAINRIAAGVDGVVSGQRKGYSPFSRSVQFAAARPLRGGRALLGLKLDPAVSPRLQPAARRESWSERLTAVVELDGPEQVDDEIGRLFAQAADNG